MKTFLGSILLTLMVAAFFGPILQDGKIPMMGDLCCLFLPAYHFFREHMLQATLPLWNPYAGCGEAFLADIERGVFYPLNLFYLVLPVNTALVFTATCHIWLAAIGTYALARLFRVSWVGSLLAGASYAFGSYTLTKLNFPSQLGATAWTPILLAAYLFWIRRPRLIPFFLLVVTITMHFLSGYPELLAFTIGSIIIMGVFVGIAKWCESGSARQLMLPLLGLVLAGVLALALGAAQFLPTWEGLSLGDKSQVVDPHVNSGSIHPLSVFNLLVPSIYGIDATRGVNYWAPTSIHYSIATYYMGVPVVAMFIAAFFRRLGGPANPTPLTTPADQITAVRTPLLITIAAIFFCFAMGDYCPLRSLLSRLIPILQKFTWPAKCLPLVTVSLGCLAGIALDYAVRPLVRRENAVWRRRLALLGPILVFLALAGFAAACLANHGQLGLTILRRWFNSGMVEATGSDTFPHIVLVADLLKVPAVGLVCTILVCLCRVGPKTTAICGAAISLLTFLDLSYPNDYVLHLGDPRAVEGKSSFLNRLRPPDRLVRFLGYKVFFVGKVRDRMNDLLSGQPKIPLIPTTGPAVGLEGSEAVIRGMRDTLYVSWPMADKAFDASSMNHFSTADVGALNSLAVDDRVPWSDRKRILALINCDRIIIAPKRSMGRTLEPAALVLLDPPMPRAWVVGGVTIVSDRNRAISLLKDSTHNPWEVAVLSDTTGNGNGLEDLHPGRVQHEITNIRYGLNRLDLDVECARNGVLVTTEAYYPGWKAFCDGELVPIYKVNTAFRGVRVPSGRHHIEMVFRPQSLTTGISISLITAAALTCIVVVHTLRRRTRHRQQTDCASTAGSLL